MLADIVVLAVIAAIAGVCLRKVVTGIKKGECDGCGSGCAGCSSASHCSGTQKKS